MAPRGLIARALRRALFAAIPPWARDDARGDLDEEYEKQVASRGIFGARMWYAREALWLSAQYSREWWRGAPDADPRHRDRSPLAFWRGLGGDLRLAVRHARHRPLFWVSAAATLGVAIGFNAAAVALVNGVLFTPLTDARPDRIVRLYAGTDQTPMSSAFSYPDLERLRAGARSFDAVIGTHLAPMALRIGAAPGLQVLGGLTSAAYFDSLGVPVIDGRGFTSAEDRAGAAPVALISEGYWRRALGADASTVGSAAVINGRPYTIIGIAGARFRGSFPITATDAWVPLESSLDLLGAQARTDTALRALQIIARLRDGVTVAEADAELAVLAPAIAALRQQTAGRMHTVPGTLLHGRFRTMASIFLSIVSGLVVLVLVVAASNVANLLLARAISRRREIAIRLSLGARRRHIVRQMAAESLLLAGGGWVLGLAIAFWTSRTFGAVALLPGFELRLDLAPDLRVFLVTGAIAAAASLAAAVAPALAVTRGTLVAQVKEGGAAVGGRRTTRMRSVLVVVQVAVAVVTCVAAGLLARSGRAASAIDLGFEREHIFATDVDLKDHAYSLDRGVVFYRELLDRLAAVPGIAEVALSNRAPLDSSTPVARVLRDSDPATMMMDGSGGIVTTFNVVSPRYFDTVGVPLVAGRGFTDTGRTGGTRVGIVNEFLVQDVWSGLPASAAIGRRIRLAHSRAATEAIGGGEIEIIGVARNAKYRTLGEGHQSHLYLPFAQAYVAGVALLVRARSSAMPVADVQSALSALDPAVQGFFTRTLTEHTRVSLLPSVVAAGISSAVGTIAALLGALGLYGLIACLVAERKRELAVRLALGARPSQVAVDVVRNAVWLTLAGVAAGTAVAFGAARFLTSLLYGVSTADPLVYGSVVGGAMVVTIAAAWLPARRAAQIDPLIALKA